MTSGRAAAIYAVALVFVAGIALLVTGSLMDLAGATPHRPAGFFQWSLNVVPPAIVGLGSYAWLSRLVARRQANGHSLANHVRRCSPLYLVAVVVGAPLIHDAPSQDFWSLGQLVLWPWLATVAGIAADASTTLGGRAGKRR